MQPGGERHADADAGVPGERLAAAVPDEARTVLQVGAAHGWVAEPLGRRRPRPTVYGAGPARPEEDPGTAALDGYFCVDLDSDLPPLAPGSVDAVVYADVLQHLRDPVAVLRRHRTLLSPSGVVVCSVPNVQHHSVVRALLRGWVPYHADGLVDPGARRLLTAGAVVQLLLDAGYAPHTVDRVDDDGAQDVVAAGAPLFELLGVGVTDAERDLGTSRLVVRGSPLPDPGPAGAPVTIVACVNDDAQLAANLLRSPCLQGDTPHEVLLFRGCASAAEGLNAGIAQARHDLVVLVHQDVYLPEGWPARLRAQWHQAGAGAAAPVGIAGVFGVLDRRVPFDAVGHVVHRDRLLAHRSLPCDVDGLDELLMVVPKGTPLRVDESLGWHLYGTDLALQAQRLGLRAVVLDAPCHHNSLTGRVPWEYRQSERVLARKWEDRLPIHTNLSSIGAWLLDGTGAPGTGAGAPDMPDMADMADADAGEGPPAAIADVVTRLRREQVALNIELEQARLQVASMQASPFWRAREAYAAVRARLSRRS